MTGNSLNFGKTQPASQMRIGNPMSNHTHSQIEDSIRFTNTNSLIRNPSQAINRPPPPQAVELGRQKNPYLSDEDEFSEFKSEEVQP
jgi:hypothetical protein